MRKLVWTLFAVFLCISCSRESTFGVKAYGHLQSFDRLGPRPTGTRQEREAAEYIIRNLKRFGLEFQRQPFNAYFRCDGAWTRFDSENVVTVIKGVRPEEYLVGAHYDSVTIGSGIQDNASGVALLLETCELLSQGPPPPYTVRIVFFGGEEMGLTGSEFYAKALTVEQANRLKGMLNFDCIAAGDRAYVYTSARGDGAIRDWMLARARTLGLALQTQSGQNPAYPAGTTGLWSDHASFIQFHIPIATFDTTNWDLGNRDSWTDVSTRYGNHGIIIHTKYDNLAYLESTFPGRTRKHLGLFSELLYRFLTDIHG